MRTVRMRIIAAVVVVLVAGVGGWRLWSSGGDKARIITVGTTDVVTSLDPAGTYDAGSWALYSNVFQSLLTFEPGGVDPVPDAAESCAFDGDQTYRCELRGDLTFASGAAVRAEDVKHSFDRIKAIGAEKGPAPLFIQLDRVEADGLTVTFHLSSPDATFPHKVATGAGSIVDRASYPADELRSGGKVDGTGPYTLAAYDEGESVKLEPNPRYRGANEQPSTAAVLRYYEDSDQLNAAWQKGRIDVAARQMPPSLLSGLTPASKEIRVTEVGGTDIRTLVLNVREQSPMSEPKVRQAVAALIDRGKLADRAYHGTVEPLYSLIPSGLTGHSVAFFEEYPKPDPDRARKLLQDAGVSVPVTFSLAYSNGAASKEEAAELTQQLEKGGLFEVRPEFYEWEAFLDGFTKGEFDAYAVGWTADFPDPDNFTGPLVGSESSLKSGYQNKKIDRLVRESQQYTERGRASDDLKEIQEIVARDVPLVPLWQRKEYVLSTHEISGSQYLSDGTGSFRLWALGWI
ncbi:ABC transporter substrate-binding protein [Streptomyces sp. E11-3]|uniref:ABC transporter substrate-binding protein n=1 Tax=Streptomyces sp. E11-3 TaxID=3110112 RepID=UPI0039800535